MPNTSLLTEYLASLNKQLANARKRHLAISLEEMRSSYLGNTERPN